MKKAVFSKLSVVALAAGIAAPVLAEDMSYTYVQLSYADTEIVDRNLDIDGDGLGISGSFELGEVAFLKAGYRTQDFGSRIDLDQWNIGVGAHFPIVENLDLVGSISYVDAQVDTRFGDVDDSGLGLGVGVRARLAEQFELEGGINYVDLDDSGDETSFVFGGRYYLSQELAFGAGFEVGSDVTTWLVSARVEF